MKTSGPVLKFAVWALVFLLIALAARIVIGYVCEKKNQSAKKWIIRIIPEVEAYHDKHLKYPEKIENISAFNQITKARVLHLFKTPPIRYSLNGEGYKVYYYQSPMGPSYGYDSITQEWFSEE
jgi:hypothetical protein